MFTKFRYSQMKRATTEPETVTVSKDAYEKLKAAAEAKKKAKRHTNGLRYGNDKLETCCGYDGVCENIVRLNAANKCCKCGYPICAECKRKHIGFLRTKWMWKHATDSKDCKHPKHPQCFTRAVNKMVRVESDDEIMCEVCEHIEQQKQDSVPDSQYEFTQRPISQEFEKSEELISPPSSPERRQNVFEEPFSSRCYLPTYLPPGEICSTRTVVTKQD